MKLFATFCLFIVLICSFFSSIFSDEGVKSHTATKPFNSAEFDDLSTDDDKPGKARLLNGMTTTHGARPGHPAISGSPPTHGHPMGHLNTTAHPLKGGKTTHAVKTLKKDVTTPKTNSTHAHVTSKKGHTKNNASHYSIASGLLITISLLSYFM